MRCMSVPFTFKGKEYYAIVRRRMKGMKTLYHIRIMNHQLDLLLSRGGLSDLEETGDGFPKSAEVHEAAMLYNLIIEGIAKQLEEADSGVMI